MEEVIPCFGLGKEVYTIGFGPLYGFHICLRADSWDEARAYLASEHFLEEMSHWDAPIAKRLKGQPWRVL